VSETTLPYHQVRPVLPVRKLEIDLSQGFARHWHGGDAFRSQFFNALSMSFPVGEQFFIDAVRDALPLLPATPENATLREAIRGFVGQEATHRRIHGLYNAQLEQQGLRNRWQHWAQRRIAMLSRITQNPRHALAVTCAYEHFTALLADGTLRYPAWLGGADERMHTVWSWHAAEETEHRAVAFDLYQAVGGNHRWRVRWYLYVCVIFAFDASRQTLLNLVRDGTWWRPGTWLSAGRFFFGREGIFWRTLPAMLRYLRRDFHPDQEHHSPPAAVLAQCWLAANSARFQLVGRADEAVSSTVKTEAAHA